MKPSKESLKALRSIPKLSATAKAVCKALAERERACRYPRFETELSRFRLELEKAKVKLVRDDYDACFRALAKAGVGTVISGRHNKPARFKWEVNPKSVGLVALEKEDELKELNPRVNPATVQEIKPRGKAKEPAPEQPTQGVTQRGNVIPLIIPFGNTQLKVEVPESVIIEQVKRAMGA
jgi:hypothetical protein